jgi:hypothetical protein
MNINCIILNRTNTDNEFQVWTYKLLKSKCMCKISWMRNKKLIKDINRIIHFGLSLAFIFALIYKKNTSFIDNHQFCLGLFVTWLRATTNKLDIYDALGLTLT